MSTGAGSGDAAPTLEEFAAELVRAGHRLARRRRTRRRVGLGVVAVAVATVASGSLVMSDGDGAEASSIAVTRLGDGTVEVRVIEISADAHQVVDDLRDAGFDPEVQPQATGPSRAGRVVSFVVDGEVSLEDDVFVARAGARLTVVAGRRAGKGEAYGAHTNPFEPGEPLACLGHVGMPAGELLVALGGVDDVEVTWQATDGAPEPSAGDTRYVIGAAATSATTVVVWMDDVAPVSPQPAHCAG